jgi:hypothetical protein
MIMNTHSKNSHLQVAVEQVTNNTTSWIGHRSRDNEDVVTGQTFISPSTGNLESIEVFSSIVAEPGKVVMTLHNFDTQHKSWGPVLGSTSVDFTKTDCGKWMAFTIAGMHLDKGQSYGFKLEGAEAYIGVGEAAGSHVHPPFSNGQEWQFTKKNKQAHSYSYFSLAFKVGLRA